MVTQSTQKAVPAPTHWRLAKGDRVAFIVDGEEYFRAVRAAMLLARKRIIMIGWDFDTRIVLPRAEKDDEEAPEVLGDLILWLVKRTPDLQIYLLRWDYGAFKAAFRGTTPFTVLRWAVDSNIHVKLDGKHPPGASHHQKILSIDDDMAFCGGIDMTGGRWDTRDHADTEPRRDLPKGKPHPPWHDASMAMQGPAARTLSDLARDRWKVATGTRLPPIVGAASCWPAHLKTQFENVEIAVSRTRPRYTGVTARHEIEALYVETIARAKHHIYAESQYFASRKVAEAIARRLTEPDGPEIVLINPLEADGWLAQKAMDTARARLYETLRRLDKRGRFRIYHPYTKGGTPIYVHAKIMIIDDVIFRVGSSNLNNRSMRLDSECDVWIDASRPANTSASKMIAQIRTGLLAEHLGCKDDQVRAIFDKTGSLITTIETLRGSGRTLRPYEIDDLSDVEKFLADNQMLDPEGPEPMFELMSGRKLLQGLR